MGTQLRLRAVRSVVSSGLAQTLHLIRVFEAFVVRRIGSMRSSSGERGCGGFECVLGPKGS